MSRYSDKVNSDIQGDSSADIDDVANVTCAAWINARTLGQNSVGAILAKISASASTGWSFNLVATNTLQIVHDYTVPAAQDMIVTASNNSIQLNRWHFVACTKDGTGTATNQKIFVDGKEVTYQTQTDGAGTRSSDAAQNLAIGRSSTGGAGMSFNGWIAHAFFFGRILTETEIRRLMSNPSSISDGLLRYYILDDGPALWNNSSPVFGVRPALGKNLGPVGTIDQTMISSQNEPPISGMLYGRPRPTKWHHARFGNPSRQLWAGYMPWRNDWWNTGAAALANLSINVFDSVVTTENVNLVFNPLLISTTDSVTTVENVSVVLQDLVINVFDSVVTTESVTVKVPLEVNVSDSSTVAENVTVVIPLEINVFDSITATENISVTLPTIDLTISIFDSITVTENNQLVIVLNANVFDSIVTAESASVSPGTGFTPRLTLLGVG